MLINFRCENFRSMRDEVTLSMLKGETRSHPNHVYDFEDLGVLKSAVIFGANASGKSNIFKAINFSRKIILGEPERAYQSYYRLEQGFEKKATTFEYEMTVDGKPYRYGFEIILAEDEIKKEWLHRISLTGEDFLLFSRVGDVIVEGSLSEKEKSVLDKNMKRYGGVSVLAICDLLRNRKKNYEVIEESSRVFDWFEKNLVPIGVNNTLRSHYEYTELEFQELGKVLRAFDVGIVEVGFTKWIDDLWINADHQFGKREKSGDFVFSDVATEKKIGDRKQMLVSRQGKNKIEMPRVDESDGTKRLFDLAPILIKDGDDEKTYVLDELDRSLHPLVVYEFVKWFLAKKFSSPKQLITTTHQILLMDQELLRKDEIWFVEKKNDGHSELFSLEEYNERSDKKIDKSYLGGRYGAIPKIHLRE